MRRAKVQETEAAKPLPRRVRSPWFKSIGPQDEVEPDISSAIAPPEQQKLEPIQDPAPALPQNDPVQPTISRRLGIVIAILFLVGISIVILGLTIARSDQSYTLPFLTPLMLETLNSFIWNYSAAIVGGAIALAGALLAGFAGRKILPDKLANLSLPLPRLRLDPFAISAVILAAICEGFLFSHLSTHQYSHWDIALFFGGLLLLGFAVFRLDTNRRPSTLHLSRLDPLLMAGLGIFAGIINSIGLTDWKFAWIGDEGSFFGLAKAITNGIGEWDFFRLNVIYDQFPMMDSAYQAAVMYVLGDNIIGWRFSEVLVMIATTTLIYLLGVALFGRVVGVVAAVILASSHYLMAFTHIAYNNTHMIFYTTLAMLMLVLAWRTQRAIFVYGTGVSMGLCLYTIQGAYLIWPTIALLLLVIFLRRPTWGQIGAVLLMLFAFAVVVTPGLLTTHLDELIRAATFLSHREVAATDPLLVARYSLVQSTVILWDNNQVADHYVGGSLVDFITGVLLFVGLFAACLRLNKRADRLVLAWFVIGLILVTVTTYQPRPPITRLLYLIPPISLLAGMAAYKLIIVLRKLLRLPAAVGYAALAIILAPIPFFNLNQLLVDTPTKIQLDPFAFVLKAIQEHPTQRIIEVGAEPEINHNLTGMLEWYPWYGGHYSYIPLADFKKPTSQDNPPVYLVDRRNDDIAPRVTTILGGDYTAIKDLDPKQEAFVWIFVPVTRAARQTP